MRRQFSCRECFSAVYMGNPGLIIPRSGHGTSVYGKEVHPDARVTKDWARNYLSSRNMTLFIGEQKNGEEKVV